MKVSLKGEGVNPMPSSVREGAAARINGLRDTPSQYLAAVQTMRGLVGSINRSVKEEIGVNG